MIQRIQTLYFLLALVALTIMFFVPYIVINEPNGVIAFKPFIVNAISIDGVSEKIFSTIYMGILLAITVIVIFLTTFAYRHRMFQIRMSLASLMAQFGIICFIIYYTVKAQNILSTMGQEPQWHIQYSIVIVLPIVSMIFTYLGYKGVIKDEAIIRSLDRIR